MTDTNTLYKEIKTLRQTLHKIPELSFQEHQTKDTLLKYLKTCDQIEVCDRGSWFYAVYHGKTSVPAIAFRADFDAVENRLGMAEHLCGHDGHAAILAGFAKHIGLTCPDRSIYFIFQPAEETGEGGKLCSELLKTDSISEIYAIHNIPGYEKGTIIILPQTFACASTGLEITFQGAPSQAAYPEAGNNPSDAIANLILFREKLLARSYSGLTLVTIIGADLGSKAYGVAASKGVLRVTIRAEKQCDFQYLTESYIKKAKELAEKYHLTCSLQKIEEFPATENHAACVEKIKHAAEDLSFPISFPSEPFRWSEDFGYYLQQCKGADFGVGSGLTCPQLHTECYEFPDTIIPYVLKMYEKLI